MRIDQTRKLHAAGILPKPAPTQDVDALRQRLDALRLVFSAESLDDLIQQSVKEDWNSTAFLDALLRLELERQEERRVAQAIRISHLPTGPTISNFDFAFQPSVSRSQIQTLANARYGKSSSTAITTNKGIASWPSVLADDEVLAGAILDRLLHSATVLNIQGRSYRLKELDAQLQELTSTATAGFQEPVAIAGTPVAGQPSGTANHPAAGEAR